jgi:hypothetical protein
MGEGPVNLFIVFSMISQQGLFCLSIVPFFWPFPGISFIFWKVRHRSGRRRDFFQSSESGKGSP